MDVQAEVDRERGALQRITAVARRSACPAFADLLGWGEASLDLVTLMNHPGVMFESCGRVVVFQQIAEELRYYAGGWCLDQNQLSLEQDRIWAEGSETGVFETVPDALAFAEQYLVEERAFQTMQVPRQLRHSRTTEQNEGGEPDRGAYE
jgi:hypothetical protein